MSIYSKYEKQIKRYFKWEGHKKAITTFDMFLTILMVGLILVFTLFAYYFFIN